MYLNVTDILTSIEPLSISQRRAAIVIVVFALLSSLAFVLIAVRTIRDTVVLFLNCGNRPSGPPEILFFRTQLGLYAGCLILGNAFIGAAGLINLSWLSRSGLSQGSTCSAQAVLMQIGLWGTCWFTAAHGIHTLIALVFRLRQARWRGVAAVSVGWTITFIAALAPMRNRNVYGPTGISCSVAHSYRKEIFFLGALPIILGVFVSTTVYAVSFIVLHGKKNANSIRKSRGLGSNNRRGVDAPEEYHKFIIMIVWTMFWFPLAFVLLLAPSCVIYILLYAGRSVPFAVRVFADICVSMLGLVNIGLLCNTFRVISPMSRTAKVAAETVMTFGHDASGESPTAPHFNFCAQPAIPSHGSSHPTYNSTQTSSNHSHNSSWSSVDSSTGLIGEKKASYKSTKTKMPPGLHIIPPAELGRQFDSEPTPPHVKAKNEGAQVMAGSPLYTINLSPCPPRVVYLTGGASRGSEPRTQDEKRSFEPMADTDTFGKVTKSPSVRSKAPLTSNVSAGGFSVVSPKVTDKSVPLATRPGVPDASGPALSMTLVPRPETNLWSPEDDADERHFSSSSYATTMTFGTDRGSHYSGEIMHAYRIRPHSQFPQPNDDDEGRDTIGSFPPDLQRRSAWWRRMTRASVWSQASGYAMEQSPNEESEEAYWQVMDELFEPEALSDDQVDAISRRATFARPQTLRVQPVKAMSKRSVHFSDTSNFKSFAAISVPNDGAV